MDNRYCDHDSVANQAIVEFNSITTRPKRILFSLCTACSNQTAVIILQFAETAVPISLSPICPASRQKRLHWITKHPFLTACRSKCICLLFQLCCAWQWIFYIYGDYKSCRRHGSSQLTYFNSLLPAIKNFTGLSISLRCTHSWERQENLAFKHSHIAPVVLKLSCQLRICSYF